MAFRLKTYVEQVADFLREEMVKGRWTGELPGADRLAAELDTNHTTVGAALRLLEKEGLLVFQGVGRRRRIVLPEDLATPSLRISILLYERIDLNVDYMVHLQHRLLEAGHFATFAPKSLIDLGMNLKRVEAMVQRTPADAWVVQSGSREVLEWFAGQEVPAMALAGRRRGVPIAGAGPDKIPAAQHAVRRLVELGHRRIVMLTREERRKPVPGLIERTFLDELEAQGITPGPYNLPDWEETPAGLGRLVESLVKHTPPTAMLIDEAPLFIGVERLLARAGFLVPRHVSLVCLDPDPAFAWYEGTAAHVRWDSAPMVRRIVGWADNVARGKDDRRMSFTKAAFVEGGTVGPTPGG